jgi:hypothetical protein
MKIRLILLVITAFVCISTLNVTLPVAYGPIKSAYAPIISSSQDSDTSQIAPVPPLHPDVQVRLWVKPMLLHLARTQPFTTLSTVVSDQPLAPAAEWIRNQTIIDDLPMHALHECLPTEPRRGESIHVSMINNLDITENGTTVTYGNEFMVMYLSTQWIAVWGARERPLTQSPFYLFFSILTRFSLIA